ncbi:MAG: M48 family metallopeptidase [Burkholderiales bacterium]|nr:M48 family metallopeptidase [Burkholderiales bacterium]
MTPERCAADYFDGRSAQARPVWLSIVGGELLIEGADDPELALRLPQRRVQWPERQRHGARLAYLPDGRGLLSCANGPAWDAWARTHGLREAWIVRWMHSWRLVAVSLALLAGVLFVLYRWGTPWAAQGLLAVTPAALDDEVGALVLHNFDRQLLQPSKLPAAQQAALRLRFEQAAARLSAAPTTAHLSGAPMARCGVIFRATPDNGIGPNAFALPGGTIVFTDAMVELLADKPEVLVGVFGHELGHVQHRHGMRMLVQTGLLAALSAALIGDFSAVLSAAPALLGQLDYARGFEYEADDAAARLMRANGIAPATLGLLFERLRQRTGGAIALPIGLATHPPDAERMRRLGMAGGTGRRD